MDSENNKIEFVVVIAIYLISTHSITSVDEINLILYYIQANSLVKLNRVMFLASILKTEKGLDMPSITHRLAYDLKAKSSLKEIDPENKLLIDTVYLSLKEMGLFNVKKELLKDDVYINTALNTSFNPDEIKKYYSNNKNKLFYNEQIGANLKEKKGRKK